MPIAGRRCPVAVKRYACTKENEGAEERLERLFPRNEKRLKLSQAILETC